MKLTEEKLRKIVHNCITEILREDRDADQWESEKRLFFKGLANGSALFDNGFVGVFYPGTENTNDPRMIYYKEGDNRLTDDHFYIQHSPVLSNRELKDIQLYTNKFGVNIEVPLEFEDEFEY